MPRIFGPMVKPAVSFSTTKLANVGACPLARLGAGQQRHPERHVGAGVGDERLPTVDQPATIAPHRPRGDAARPNPHRARSNRTRRGRVPRPTVAANALAARRCRRGTAATNRWSRAPATRRPPTGRPGRSAPSRRRSRRSTCRCRPTARGSACRAGPTHPSRGAGRSGTAPPPTPGGTPAISFCANSRQRPTRSRSDSVSEKSTGGSYWTDRYNACYRYLLL